MPSVIAVLECREALAREELSPSPGADPRPTTAPHGETLRAACAACRGVVTRASTNNPDSPPPAVFVVGFPRAEPFGLVTTAGVAYSSGLSSWKRGGTLPTGEGGVPTLRSLRYSRAPGRETSEGDAGRGPPSVLHLPDVQCWTVWRARLLNLDDRCRGRSPDRVRSGTATDRSFVACVTALLQIAILP